MARAHLFSNDPFMILHARIDEMQREINMLRNAVAPRTKQYEFKVIADTAALATGEALFTWSIPHDVNRATLVEAHAYVIVVSSSGKPTIQVRNRTTGFDMLLTPITIDVSESSSYTASVPSLIDPANAVVRRDNQIGIDVDAAGTGTLGLGMILTFA